LGKKIFKEQVGWNLNIFCLGQFFLAPPFCGQFLGAFSKRGKASSIRGLGDFWFSLQLWENFKSKDSTPRFLRTRGFWHHKRSNSFWGWGTKELCPLEEPSGGTFYTL